MELERWMCIKDDISIPVMNMDLYLFGRRIELKAVR